AGPALADDSRIQADADVIDPVDRSQTGHPGLDPDADVTDEAPARLADREEAVPRIGEHRAAALAAVIDAVPARVAPADDAQRVGLGQRCQRDCPDGHRGSLRA